MSENTFKIQDGRKRSVFRWLEEKLKLRADWEEGLPVTYLPHVLFIAFLCIIYIGNSHYGESSQRKLSKLKIEVDNLRADYTTLKADYMHKRLQSEVAKRVKDLGLEESSVPPYKLIVKEGEY